MPSLLLEPKKPAPALVKAEKKSTWWEKERTPRLVETGAGHAVTVSVNLLTAPKDKHGKGALGTLKALAKGRPTRSAPPPKIETRLDYDSSASSSPRSSSSSAPPSPPPYDDVPEPEQEPVFTPFPRRPLPPRRSDECDRIRDDTPLRHGVLMSEGLRAQSMKSRSAEMAMGPEELTAWLAGMRRQIRRELAEEKEAIERLRKRQELSERARRRHQREMERLDEEKTVARFTCVVKGLAAQARSTVRPGGEKSKWLVGYA
ncbi:unnamed protein product [Peniophora sp. CBMAI 1063]|nr:unnamed protein product [Peniophora sp. CBMAI 1063]